MKTPGVLTARSRATFISRAAGSTLHGRTKAANAKNWLNLRNPDGCAEIAVRWSTWIKSSIYASSSTVGITIQLIMYGVGEQSTVGILSWCECRWGWNSTKWEGDLMVRDLMEQRQRLTTSSNASPYRGTQG